MRPKVVRKADAALRWGLARGVGRLRGDLLVNEYPKSGGSWIGGMVAEALELPFPRNRFPTLRRCILHGHLLPGAGRPRTILVWRDGRDVMVSWYHHCLFRNERENADLVARTRAEFAVSDPEDVRAHLPAFIHYVFTRQAHPGFTWTAFVDAWHGDPAATHTSYEAMRANPVDALSRVLESVADTPYARAGSGGAGSGSAGSRSAGAGAKLAALEDIVERHSFAAKAGRSAGTERRGSFLRKGIVGDWKNHFSEAAGRTFHAHAGDALVRLGYESDAAWVEMLPNG